MKRLIFILLIIIPLQLTATNYYVKPTGNDGLSGTSIANAWATIAQVNYFSINTGFQPGDNIYFERGGTYLVPNGTSPDYNDWSTGLFVQQSGTAGSPITIGAYGTGERPIIQGRQSIPGWNTTGNWTNLGSNIWRMVASIYAYTESNQDRGRLWINGTEVKKAQSITTPTVNEPWTHSNSGYYLYVYSTSNPATAFTNIEDQGWFNDCVVVGGDYQTYQNLTIRGGNHSIQCHFKTNTIIEYCDVGEYCGMQGIFVDGEYGGGDNGIIRYCTFDTKNTTKDGWMRVNTEDAIHFRNGCSNWDIHDNTIKNWEHAGLGIVALGSLSCTNILFHDNTVSGTDVDFSKAIDIAAASGRLSGVKIYNNTFYDFPGEMQLCGPNIEFYCNIVDKTTRPDYYDNGYWETMYGYVPGALSHGLVFFNHDGTGSTPAGSKIYNNTIVNCYDPGIAYQTWGTLTLQSVDITNNLLYNNDTKAGTYSYQLYIPTSDVGANTYRNNAIYSPTDAYSVFYERATPDNQTVAGFNALNGNNSNVITNNIVADVAASLFVDFAGRDYHIITDANVIAAGIDVDIITDMDGIAFGSTPSIGAYEFNGDPPDPAGLPTVTTSAVSFLWSKGLTAGGNVSDDGGAAVTARGICWSTSANPTTADSHTSDGTGEGAFTSTATSMLSNTIYYMRAYATNATGTAYGVDVQLTTTAFSFYKIGGKYTKINGKYLIID